MLMFLLNEKCTNYLILKSWLMWNVIPSSLGPLIYGITYLTATMRPGDRLFWCLARIDVITERSGQVPI